MKLNTQAWVRSPLMGVFVISAAITICYAPLFGGYWLGDDFVNLLISYDLAQDGKLFSGTLEYFTKGTSSAGSMYRPLQMASLLGNYAIAGSYYPGWFAVNFVLHLANAILVFYVVRMFAARLSNDDQPIPILAPLLAALAFALAPPLAEGVFWVSARADACVTLLSLLSLLAWVHSTKPQQGRAVWWFPALLVPALLIKESAAILPLQMALITAALWPAMRRQHFLSLSLSLALVGAFFAMRWSLFGHAFGVYASPGSSAQSPTLTVLWATLASISPWWQALTHDTPKAATLCLALSVGALLWACLRLRGAHARICLALVSASSGLALATLLNLGGLAAAGEGGRLTYGPICWLTLAVGVALVNSTHAAKHVWVARTLLASSVVCGSIVLYSIITQVREAQATTRDIARSISWWAATHEGHAMIIIPEMVHFVVATRNAQGGLVMPPVQASGMLHRAIPTLPSEVTMRFEQYQNGLATQLASNPPTRLSEAAIASMLKSAPPRWPPHFLCWSARSHALRKITAPRNAESVSWTKDLQKSLIAICQH